MKTLDKIFGIMAVLSKPNSIVFIFKTNNMHTTKDADKKQKKKTSVLTTISVVLAIGLILFSPMTIIPNVSAQQPLQNTSVQKVAKPFYLPNPTLSTTEKQELVNIAMNLPEVKAWSSQWQFSTINFKGQKTDAGLNWNEAIVILRLSPTSSAPFQCSVGWIAGVRIDMATHKVIGAWYPTIQSHPCYNLRLGKADTAGHSDPPGYAIARQDDVASQTWYGNSATIETPSFNSNIYNDMNQYVGNTVNVLWNQSCSGFTGCFLQGGWLITVLGNAVDGINPDSADIVFVDESTIGSDAPINTNVSYTGGGTETAGINCASGSTDAVISIQYGINTYNENSLVPCSSGQVSSDTDDNSVFFENWNTVSSSKWSPDITGTVQGTGADEYDSSNVAYSWSSSSNWDKDCYGTHTSSQVIASGTSLANGGTYVQD
jgi:hypothetical protein